MTDHRIQVAVYWPSHDVYGGAVPVATMAEAHAKAAVLAKQGYDSDKSCIHIIETTRHITKWTDGDGMEDGC